MKTLRLWFLTVWFFVSLLALALPHQRVMASSELSNDSPPAAVPASNPPEMTDADIRKIDVANLKITLKHAHIKSIDMPPMTMVFSAKDKTVLDGLAVGDKVQFALDLTGRQFTVIAIKKITP